jgi:hypothetical protein
MDRHWQFQAYLAVCKGFRLFGGMMAPAPSRELAKSFETSSFCVMSAVHEVWHGGVSPTPWTMLKGSYGIPHSKYVVFSCERSPNVKVRLNDASTKAIDGFQVPGVWERELIRTNADDFSILEMRLYDGNKSTFAFMFGGPRSTLPWTFTAFTNRAT